MRSEPYEPKCKKCDCGLHRIKYKYKGKTITTKYRFTDDDNYISWCILHGKPYKDYEILEMICDVE